MKELMLKRIFSILFILTLLILFISQIKADDYFYANGTAIYKNGTVQFFRGINYLSKLGGPTTNYYIPPQETDIQLISSYGFNAIRLPLATYQLIQSSVWNMTVMGWLNDTVNWSKTNNLSVLLDLHDDTSGAGDEWGGLIENSSDKWGELADFWSYISNNFKNETDIIGYDLINEPLFYKPFRSDVNKTIVSELWIDWINNTYLNDSDKLNKSWNGFATFLTFDNATSYSNTTSGMLLYWRMDNTSIESSTLAYDWTGNGNNATITGPQFNASGIINGAYDFTISRYMQTASGYNNYTLTQFAVSFWMKCYSSTQSSGGSVLFAALNDSTNIATYIYIYPQNNGKLYTYFKNSSFNDPGTLNKLISNKQICNTTDWNHVVFQYNGTQEQLYVNGLLDNTYDITSDLANISRLKVGWGNIANAFNGSLDEVIFFNRTLNYSEIWAMSKDHNKLGDTETIATAKIPSIFYGIDNGERRHTTPNIMSNPSFETWTTVPSSWTNYTPVLQIPESTKGDYSVRINATTSTPILYQVFYANTEPNWTKDFLITFDAKILSSARDDCTLRIACHDSWSFYDTTNKYLDFSNISWNSYSLEIEADSRFNFCSLEFTSTGSCDALIDNVNMTLESHSNRLADFYKFLNHRYKTLLEYLITTIRQNDQNHMIFFDSLGNSDGFHLSVIPLDFELPSDTIQNKLGYSPHHYYNPPNSITGWGYIMHSYPSMNIPWITGETGYNHGIIWISMISKTIKYGGSGFFHWSQISNVSALGYGATTTSDAYYCNNVSSINCLCLVSGINYSNLTMTPKGYQYKYNINPIFREYSEYDGEDSLFIYSDGSYTARDPSFYENVFKEQLERFNKRILLASSDNLIYNISLPKTNYLNLSYYNYTIPDQTRINWTNFDRIIVVQDSYKGSARTGYLLEDMINSGKRVAFIGQPYVIQYPFYDFRDDGYLGNGIGKENSNYSFNFWFNSTTIPNMTSSSTFSSTASIDFYGINAGQSYTFESESGNLMNVSLPEGASWIFPDCMWNKSNQLYLCAVPKFSGPTYDRTSSGDTVDIASSIIRWLYNDETLSSVGGSFNITYLNFTDSNNEIYYYVTGNYVNVSNYNLVLPYITKVWNYINKTIECSNCSSFLLNLTDSESKIYFINISNVSLIEGELVNVRDTSNNIIDGNLSVWVTASSTNFTKYIASNLTLPLDITFVANVDNCSISSVEYTSHNSNYIKAYSNSEWICSNNFLTLNITGIETASGSNKLEIFYKSVTPFQTSSTFSGRIYKENSSLVPNKNYTYNITPADRIYFIFNEKSYFLEITRFNNNSISFKIIPTNIQKKLSPGETVNLDLTSDKKEDISIYLKEIQNRTINLIINVLSEEEKSAIEQKKTEQRDTSLLFLYSLAIVLILLLIIILFLGKKSKHKKN